MDAKSFLDDFGYLVNAPGGVQRLREVIYHLAVIGTLCPQDPAEGTGNDLHEAISTEKQRRIQEKCFKRTPKMENLKGTFCDSLPDIPKTWIWSRLVDIGEISPRNSAEDDVLASFASMSTISDIHGIPPEPEDRPWGKIKKGYTHFANGDVVLAKITPCFENGKSAVMKELTNGIGAGTTELHVVRPLPGVAPGFIYIFLRSPYFKIAGERYMTGTAGQKRLPTEYFATRPFPLPPLNEQERIVTRVDQLAALADQLEGQQTLKSKVAAAYAQAAAATIIGTHYRDSES